MSRISLFNLSFDIRAETIEQKLPLLRKGSPGFCIRDAMRSLNSVCDMQNLVLFHIANLTNHSSRYLL